MAEAGGLENLYQQNKDAGLMVVNVIIENEASEAPSQEDLQGWAAEFGLTIPVVADPGSGTMYSYATGGSVGLPFTVLLDRGVVVESTDYPSGEDAAALAQEGR